MNFSEQFQEALDHVYRLSSAEIKRLKDENLKLQSRLGEFDKVPNHNPVSEHTSHPQPEAEPVLAPLGISSVLSTESLAHSLSGFLSAHKHDEDAQAIKDLYKAKSQSDVCEPKDVTEQYYDKGLAQLIARSSYFENITLSVVVLNGIWIAIDVDFNDNSGENIIWAIMDNFFCAYFSFELITRFAAFRTKYRVFCDRWFVFDLALVLMMVMETWAMPLYSLLSGTESAGAGNAQVLRLLRLLRLSRMAKMMRSMPELMILIKGTVVGIRSVAITLVLLGGITAVFAIAMRTLTDGTEVGAENFGSVPYSAYTLIIEGVIPDNGSLMTALGETQWYYAIVFFLFIFLAALTFMNMLIGILCDAVHGVSCDEKEDIKKQQLKDSLKASFSDQSTEFLDAEGKVVGKVQSPMFVESIKQEEVWGCMEDLDVDIPSLSDNITGIFEAHSSATAPGMEFDEFFEEILKFRATPESTIKGIFDLRKIVHDSFDDVNEKLKSLALLQGQMTTHSPAPNPIQAVHDRNSGKSLAELEAIKQKLESISSVLEACTQFGGPGNFAKIQNNGGAAISCQSYSNQATKCANWPEKSSQAMPVNAAMTATHMQGVGPQEVILANRADRGGSVMYNNGMQPYSAAMQSRSTAADNAAGLAQSEAREAQSTRDQEGLPLLGQTQERSHLVSNSNEQVWHVMPDAGGALHSEIFRHYAYFAEQVTKLEFRVEWAHERPIAIDVKAGGEAERQGIMSGDTLAEMNGTDRKSVV